MEAQSQDSKISQVSYLQSITIVAKYFPRPESYTDTFLGGNFNDTGLNTFKTPSRVHQNYDQ